MLADYSRFDSISARSGRAAHSRLADIAESSYPPCTPVAKLVSGATGRRRSSCQCGLEDRINSWYEVGDESVTVSTPAAAVLWATVFCFRSPAVLQAGARANSRSETNCSCSVAFHCSCSVAFHSWYTIHSREYIFAFGFETGRSRLASLAGVWDRLLISV